MLTNLPSHLIIKSESAQPNAPTPKFQSTQPNALPPHLDTSTLRARLGLNKWKCGSLTRKGGLCSRSIPKENRARIDSLIQAIVVSSESSSRRPQQLDDIAILAHCIFHERMPPSDYRMADWMSIFHSEGDSRDQIMEVLGPCSALCRAGSKCNNYIGGQKVRNYKRTIGEIIKPEIYSDDRYLGYFLCVLEANMYCPEHEGADNKMSALWKTKIRDIVPIIEVKSNKSNTDSEMERLEDQIQALTLEKNKRRDLSPSNNPKSSNLTGQPSTFLNIDKDPALFWPIELDKTPLRIVKKQRTQKSPEVLIRSEMQSPLKPIMKRPGYIYLFEAENNKELLKIGYTTRSVSERQAEWSFQCNRKMTIVFPIASDTPALIPNAYRVEALCHAELDGCRKMVYCEGCLAHHNEWFHVSREKAIAVIKKWSTWMASNPYDAELGHLKKDKGIRENMQLI